MSYRTTPISSMKDAFSVKDFNVVVTGGNRGIGFGISAAYAQGGANVAILCRDINKGDEAVRELEQYGTKCFCIMCDVSSLRNAKAAAEEVFKIFPNVDVLVNNSGISAVAEFLDDGDLEGWHRVMNTNLHGPANMIYAIVPHMIKADRGGSVINISSTGGQALGGARTHPMAGYHASKAALDMFTRNMAIEFGDYGIRVNGIAPGPTHSDLDKYLPPDALEKFANLMPMHRFAEPIEIGALCVYLSSPAGNHITGTIVVHDGGLLQIS
jgi:NAD(P)-dependent dehydrogenase (short-subunit alcohol dehydrogenase family)